MTERRIDRASGELYRKRVAKECIERSALSVLRIPRRMRGSISDQLFGLLYALRDDLS